MRPPNAIDFWRGVALVMIFVNHVPGMDYSILTMRNYAIADAADLFVFLAGCSLAYVAGGQDGAKPLRKVVPRLLFRAFDIWQAQIVTISVAVALLAASAIAFSDPLFLEWHGAGPMFVDTARASVGLVLLTYQIGYFNILPLYVVLMMIATVFVVISRLSLILAVFASVALYALTLTYQLQLPSWPAHGAWFFNPLAWQLLIVVGYVSIKVLREHPESNVMMRKAWPFAAGLTAFVTAIVLIDYRPDPMSVPSPRYFFLFDKAYLSPARIINMVAIAIAFYPAFPVILRVMGPVARYCSSLGRNSLAVFCVASLLALAGQIVRYVGEPTMLLDTAIVITGLVLLRGTAWIADSRPHAA